METNSNVVTTVLEPADAQKINASDKREEAMRVRAFKQRKADLKLQDMLEEAYDMLEEAKRLDDIINA